MKCAHARLSGRQISEFLAASRINVFDPETLELVAQVSYRRDGCVEMETTDGGTDRGVWGIDGDLYWTQYECFRGGLRHEFSLEVVSGDIMQAYFGDGQRAFLQTHKPSLAPSLGQL